jgi:hypothetical protein
MKEEDMAELSESEVSKIERINQSFAERADAEARLESQKKYRILFERAAEETLPFIVYVIYMGALGVAVVFKLVDYKGEQLYIGGFLLFVVMVAPLFVLPSEHWHKLFSYLRNKFRGSEQG